MIKAVLLDADGVIQKTDSRFLEQLRALVPENQEDFLKDIFTSEQPCATGAKDFREQLQGVLSAWQVSDDVDQVLKIWQQIQMIPKLPELLHKINTHGAVTSLATNQQSYRMNFMRQNLGYEALFDFGFYSCELGAKKPHAEFFNAAIARLEVDADQCLFIDDSQPNVAGAVACGLQGVHYAFTDITTAAAELEALILSRL